MEGFDFKNIYFASTKYACVHTSIQIGNYVCKMHVLVCKLGNSQYLLCSHKYFFQCAGLYFVDVISCNINRCVVCIKKHCQITAVQSLRNVIKLLWFQKYFTVCCTIYLMLSWHLCRNVVTADYNHYLLNF